MTDSAFELYKHISSYRRVRELIDNGESESIHLECKAPTQPRLNRNLQVHLARAISGFSNTAGGVILWGVSTTKHSHSGLDILTQIEPIGNILSFERQIGSRFPLLSTPPILGYESKAIKRRKTDTKGLVVTYIPKTNGDPIQSAKDDHFYFRSGDEFTIAPYDVIKRLFASTESPDLFAQIHVEMAEKQKDDAWKIPIGVQNRSSAVAENAVIYVEITNPSACKNISANKFQDVSSINPGMKIFSADFQKVIHRGLNVLGGEILLTMHDGSSAKKKVELKLNLYANRMTAKTFTVTLHITKTRCKIVKYDEKNLY